MSMDLNMTEKTETGKPFTGKKLLVWIGCFLGVMFIANGFFVYFALSSFSGLETESAYKEGLVYGQTLEAARHQAELGWTVSLGAPKENEAQLIRVEASDKAGKAINSAKVTVSLKRPASDKHDQTLELVEVGNGIYQALVSPLLPGRWIAELAIEGANGEAFKSRNDLILP